jgi:hypothetical protein
MLDAGKRKEASARSKKRNISWMQDRKFLDVRIGKNFCTGREILPRYKNAKHFI